MDKLDDLVAVAKARGRIEILEELTDDYQTNWTYVEISKWINRKLAEV